MSTPPPARIAYVQRGDYAAALRAIGSGAADTYQGQSATVGAFERFAARAGAAIVVSIGSTPERLDRDRGPVITHVRGGPRWVPGRVREALLARRILADLRAFAPTHLVLRLTDVVGTRVLGWAVRRRLPTAIIVASTLRPESPLDRRFCALANDPCVAFVANHLRVATESLARCGLDPKKAIAYDVPGRLEPDDFPAKTLDPAREPALLYVGTLSVDKGAGDLLDAMDVLRARGRAWRLTACGDGPLASRFREASADAARGVDYLGRVPRDRVVDLTARCALAIVPSRPSFAEGLPLTLLEALATRTPVVASGHPVFRAYFAEGAGVTFFAPADPAALADAIERLLTSPEAYADLSTSTLDAWQSVQTPTGFGELFDRAATAWGW